MKARNVDSDSFVMIDEKRNLQTHFRNGIEVELVNSEDSDGYCKVSYVRQPYRVLREFLPGVNKDFSGK